MEAGVSEAVLDEVGRYYLALTEASFETDLPLADRFAAVLEGIATSIDSDPDHARVFFNWRSAIGVGEMMVRMRFAGRPPREIRRSNRSMLGMVFRGT